jgi:hypothetical protein
MYRTVQYQYAVGYINHAPLGTFFTPLDITGYRISNLLPLGKQFYSTLHENPIFVFLFRELRGLSLNFHIHVSVNDIYTLFPRSVYIFPASE